MTIELETVLAAAIPSLISGVVIFLVKKAERVRSEIVTKLDENTRVTVASKQKIDDLEARVGRQNGRIDKLESWRDRHMERHAGKTELPE